MRFLQLALSGQVLTFAAMMTPVLARRADQVVVLVFASAIAVLVTNAGVLAYPFLYPVLSGPRMARLATVLSLWSLGFVSVVVAACTPLESPLGMPTGTMAAAASLTFAGGIYVLLIARLVRAADTTGIGLSRLYYGVVLFMGALVTSLTHLGPLALTFAHSTAYATASFALTWRRSHWGPALGPVSAASRRRLRRAYLSRTVRPTCSSLASGWTGVLPGLILPGLGVAAEPWAVVNRICGGFATLLETILGPPLEARLARSIRNRDHAAFTSARRLALLVGTFVSAVAVTAGLGLAAYATGFADMDEWFLPVAAATVLFWGLLLAAMPINRLPNFLGRDAARLVWDTGRAALISVAVFVVDGVAQLIVMGVLLTASGVFLLPMTAWRPRPRALE